MLAEQASASSPTPVVEVLPISRSIDVTSALPDIDIRVNSADVSKVTIQSVIKSAMGVIVSSPRPIEAIISEAAVAPFDDLESDVGSVDPPRVVTARLGDVVTFSSPHLLSLQQGLYEQTITVTIPVPNRPSPLAYATTRSMDVRADGIHWLTGREYADMVSPKTLLPRPDGTLVLGLVGHLGPAEPAGLKITQLTDAIQVDVVTEAKGSAQ
jgi:hypothetical protein